MGQLYIVGVTNLMNPVMTRTEMSLERPALVEQSVRQAEHQLTAQNCNAFYYRL